MIVLGSIPIFTFALGTWQVQRLKWKISLIDELTEKLEREPLVLPNKVKCVLNCLIYAFTAPYALLSAYQLFLNSYTAKWS